MTEKKPPTEPTKGTTEQTEKESPFRELRALESQGKKSVSGNPVFSPNGLLALAPLAVGHEVEVHLHLAAAAHQLQPQVVTLVGVRRP